MTNSFDNTIQIIKAAIANRIRMREWYRKELRKKIPYKCRTKTDIIKTKSKFKRQIKHSNIVIAEYRKALKKLNP